MIRAATSFILLLLTTPVGTETVEVRDSGRIDLGTFECRDINRSTVIQRVCYDKARHTLIVGVKGGYVRYCEFPAGIFDGFMNAPSMGQYYARNIAIAGPDGRYGCRAPRGS